MCKNLGQVSHSMCASVQYKQVPGGTMNVIEIFVTGYSCLHKHGAAPQGDEMVLVCVPIPGKVLVKSAEHVIDVNFRL